MSSISNSTICIAGKNEIAVFGLDLIRALIDHRNIRVICNRSDSGMNTWQPSLRKAAIEADIQTISLQECYPIPSLIFISLEFDQILNPSDFSDARLYNIHFSKLPAYKGMYTSALPILNGESESGVTLHEIDTGIDTGPIIDQLTIPIATTDTAKDLYRKYTISAKNLLARHITNLLTNDFTSTPQNIVGSTYFSAKSINYSDLRIDLRSTADQIRNQIRAYYFPEYQVPMIHGYAVKAAAVLNKRSTEPPGKIIQISEMFLAIATIDYDIRIYRDKRFELLASAKTDDLDLLKECLECGQCVNIRNVDGATPLMTAIHYGSRKVAEHLIRQKCDLKLLDYSGSNAMSYAIEYYEATGDNVFIELFSKQDIL